MDVKHIDKKICHGVQCSICREKIVKLFRNMKDCLLRFVYTHDLISAFLFYCEFVCKQTSLYCLLQTWKNVGYHRSDDLWQLFEHLHKTGPYPRVSKRNRKAVWLHWCCFKKRNQVAQGRVSCQNDLSVKTMNRMKQEHWLCIIVLYMIRSNKGINH